MIQSLINTLISLVTLTFLEIILGVDNLIFLSIIADRLPKPQQKHARQIGLLFALFTRLALLASVLWLIGFTKPLMTISSFALSGRDIVLILGGLFLLYKSTDEIHAEFTPLIQNVNTKKRNSTNFFWVVTQIAILDIIFSLDSVFTAVGMTQQFWVMAVAITIAILTMIFASETLSRFINRYPTIKMLALSFLLLIGTVLIADGLHFHVPRQYIYFALSFSVIVEILNISIARKRQRKNR